MWNRSKYWVWWWWFVACKCVRVNAHSHVFLRGAYRCPRADTLVCLGKRSDVCLVHLRDVGRADMPGLKGFSRVLNGTVECHHRPAHCKLWNSRHTSEINTVHLCYQHKREVNPRNRERERVRERGEWDWKRKRKTNITRVPQSSPKGFQCNVTAMLNTEHNTSWCNKLH